MIQLNVGELKKDMVTGEAIFSLDGSLELLKAGTILSKRHISLLANAGIEKVVILEESDNIDELNLELASSEEEIKDALKAADIKDADEFIDKIKEIENSDYSDIVTSIYNRNMEIHVLTGEGNIPIDIKFNKEIGEIKAVFETLKNSDNLDMEELEKNVKTMLPSMTKNNDVLMRIRQLQESDDYLFDHSFRVSILSASVAKWLGYTETDRKNIALAALLYEVGNLKIPNHILKKEGPLSKAEMQIVRKHPQLAYHVLLKTKGVNQDIKFVALQHHERMDGSGYPLKVKANQIHDFSKIIMVCDVFDALTHDRPYRKKISPFDAAEYILWQSGFTFDTKVCYFFLKNLAEYYTGKTCFLNTGEIATIVYVDVNYPTRPVIKIDDKFINLNTESEYKILDFMD